MPTVHVPAQLSVKYLMAAVKQLSPVELHEFMQQVAPWQQQSRSFTRVTSVGHGISHGAWIAWIFEGGPRQEERLWWRSICIALNSVICVSCSVPLANILPQLGRTDKTNKAHFTLRVNRHVVRANTLSPRSGPLRLRCASA